MRPGVGIRDWGNRSGQAQVSADPDCVRDQLATCILTHGGWCWATP